jgi:uncharacterized membrane protein YphA (DoxX/SURF4 family)
MGSDVDAAHKEENQVQGPLSWVERCVEATRRRRGWHLFAAILRIFLGFALLPSGLKKVIGEPFTDPANVGPFHDFLDAFYATGFFYPFVGSMQVLTALLLMSQRFALVGALMMLPIITTILVFCWSTGVYPTASVVTLMWFGTVGLVLWDISRWRGIFVQGGDSRPKTESHDRLETRLWERCGLAIFGVYLVVTALNGEVYRPRGMELDKPGFYLFPALLVLLIATWVLDRRAWMARSGRVE